MKLIGGRFKVEKVTEFVVLDTWLENRVAEQDFTSRADAEAWARKYVADDKERGAPTKAALVKAGCL
jgi:hypothetical protein